MVDIGQQQFTLTTSNGVYNVVYPNVKAVIVERTNVQEGGHQDDNEQVGNPDVTLTKTALSNGGFNYSVNSEWFTSDLNEIGEEGLQRKFDGGSRKKIYFCTICGVEFKKKRDLNIHLKTHDQELYCPKCEKKFNSRFGYKQHLLKHENAKPFMCLECGKSYSSRFSFTNHMNTHSGVKPYSCDICGLKFTYGNVLRDHMAVHTGEKLYKCSFCDHAFSTRNGMKSHVKYIHKEKQFNCEKCEKKFAIKSDLTKHLRTHGIGKVDFPCVLCGRVLKSPECLRNHLKNHEKYICKICGINCLDKKGLKTHMGVFPMTHKCSQCQKLFHEIEALQKHMTEHEKETAASSKVGENDTAQSLTSDAANVSTSNDTLPCRNNPEISKAVSSCIGQILNVVEKEFSGPKSVSNRSEVDSLALPSVGENRPALDGINGQLTFTNKMNGSLPLTSVNRNEQNNSILNSKFDHLTCETTAENSGSVSPSCVNGDGHAVGVNCSLPPTTEERNTDSLFPPSVSGNVLKLNMIHDRVFSADNHNSCGDRDQSKPQNDEILAKEMNSIGTILTHRSVDVAQSDAPKTHKTASQSTQTMDLDVGSDSESVENCEEVVPEYEQFTVASSQPVSTVQKDHYMNTCVNTAAQNLATDFIYCQNYVPMATGYLGRTSDPCMNDHALYTSNNNGNITSSGHFMSNASRTYDNDLTFGCGFSEPSRCFSADQGGQLFNSRGLNYSFSNADSFSSQPGSMYQQCSGIDQNCSNPVQPLLPVFSQPNIGQSLPHADTLLRRNNSMKLPAQNISSQMQDNGIFGNTTLSSQQEISQSSFFSSSVSNLDSGNSGYQQDCSLNVQTSDNDRSFISFLDQPLELAGSELENWASTTVFDQYSIPSPPPSMLPTQIQSWQISTLDHTLQFTFPEGGAEELGLPECNIENDQPLPREMQLTHCPQTCNQIPNFSEQNVLLESVELTPPDAKKLKKICPASQSPCKTSGKRSNCKKFGGNCEHCHSNSQLAVHCLHNMSSHFGQVTLSCAMCKGNNTDQACSNADNTKKGKIHVCEVCRKSFKARRYLKTHYKTHSEHPQCQDSGEIFTCVLCKEIFKSWSSFKVHLGGHKDSVFCDVCHELFQDREMLARHKKDFDGIVPTTCGVCGKTFHDKLVASKHMSAHFTLPVNFDHAAAL